MKRIWKYISICLCSLFIIGSIFGGVAYYYLFTPQFHPGQTCYIYIDRDDNQDSVIYKIKTVGNPNKLNGLIWMANYRGYGENIHTGRYAIHPEDNAYHLFSRLYRGYQEPTNLVIGSVRTMDRLAQNVGKQIMIDSAEIASLVFDSAYIQKMGYSSETIASLFIPNTYQVYWNISAENFIKRMQKEHERFWNDERKNKAQAIGLTPIEVTTLASIVDEETNNKAEKPIVAGLYINRLQRGMPLQADPTIKFAWQDFSLRRVTNKHLEIQSPYNTYIHAGLPPGPIRIPSVAGIDAVLNYKKHNYLYMCAKEDFSGTHNFAVTLREHMNNARKYWNALNKRKIYK